MSLYQVNPWMILPFGVLLGMIAMGPLWFGKWWGKHYAKVSFGLGAVTLAYYFLALPPKASETVAHTASEYFSFIVLIGSLFVVSGGIHINVKGEATPTVNVFFLFIGALIANVLGTTGASMLLIRPWLRMNKYRVTGFHVVFFIFIVSNVGGCLTPIGDPPLFLGYLKGIPFWWVAEHCWPMWLVGVGLLLLIFFVLDRRNYLRAPKPVRAEIAEPPDRWRFEGLANLFFLGVILIAVFLQHPPFLREGLMIAASFFSHFTTSRTVHEANHFNFHPIREVAILFVGIFATMIPALDWLQMNARQFGEATPTLFYWGSGSLSSVLDNAPTYLSFLSAAFGTFVGPEVVDKVQQVLQLSPLDWNNAAEPIRNCIAGLQRYFPGFLESKSVAREHIEVAYLLGNLNLNQIIVALSIGSVFFGANTYIGNGPNFLVKSIADHQKIHTPGFLGYVFQYTLPFMLPVLLVVWLIFFR
jgi:Na+/H+ antiporter NhaD/arsenite permease-like protein